VQSTARLVKLDDGFFSWSAATFSWARIERSKRPVKRIRKRFADVFGRNSEAAGSPRRRQLEVTMGVERFQDPEFARRDLNVAHVILPDRSLAAAAYGGVFTKEQLNFTHPIYFARGMAPHVDNEFEQKMSAYTAATMLLFDPDASKCTRHSSEESAGWTWDYKRGQFEKAAMIGDKSKESGYSRRHAVDRSHYDPGTRAAGDGRVGWQPSNRLPDFSEPTPRSGRPRV